MTEAENILVEIVQKCIKQMYPYECPACHGLSSGNSNDKGICDTCFLHEAYQRALHSLTLEDSHRFQEWFISHSRVEETYDDRPGGVK